MMEGNDTFVVMPVTTVSTATTPLPGCGRLCGARVAFPSKRAFTVAISEGDLTRDGRCHYCGAMAVYNKQTIAGKAVAQQPTIRAQRAKAPQVPKVKLPYKKQNCDVVVTVGPLELVYPALVVEEETPKPHRATICPKIVAGGVVPPLEVAVAPSWLTAFPAKPQVTPPVVLTQKKQFQLLKKRLVKLGRERIRAAQKARRARQAEALKAKQCYDAKVATLTALVIEGRRIISLNSICKELGTPKTLTKAEEAFVADSCRKAEEERASWAAFLLRVRNNPKKKECPQEAPCGINIPAERLKTASVPWANLGLSAQSYAGFEPRDGTMGAPTLAREFENSLCPYGQIVKGLNSLPMTVHSVPRVSSKKGRTIFEVIRTIANSIGLVTVQHLQLCSKFVSWVFKPCKWFDSAEDFISEAQTPIETWSSGTAVYTNHFRYVQALPRATYKAPRNSIEDETMISLPWWNRPPHHKIPEVDFYAHRSFCSFFFGGHSYYTTVYKYVPLLARTNSISNLGDLEMPNLHDLFHEDIIDIVPPNCEKMLTPFEVYTLFRQGEKDLMGTFTCPMVKAAALVGANNIFFYNNRAGYNSLFKRKELLPIRKNSLILNDWVIEGYEPLFDQCFDYIKCATVHEVYVALRMAGDGMGNDLISSDTARSILGCTSFNRFVPAPFFSTFGRKTRTMASLRPYYFDVDLKGSANCIHCIAHYKFEQEVQWKEMDRLNELHKAGTPQDLTIGCYCDSRHYAGKALHEKNFYTYATRFKPRNQWVLYPWNKVQPVYWDDTQLSGDPTSIFCIEFDSCWDTMIKDDTPQIEQVSSSFGMLTGMFARRIFRTDSVEPMTIDALEATRGMRFTLHSGRRPEEIQSDLADLAKDANEDHHGGRTLVEIVRDLRSKKRPIKGSEENMLGAERVVLREKDIFARSPVGSWFNSGTKNVKPICTIMGKTETVRLPKAGTFTYTPLPVLPYEDIRKLAEKGWDTSRVVALDVHIKSLIPEGIPIEDLTLVMDGQSNDARYATLCGGYMDLGREKAKLLSLPLCTFGLTKALADIEAYDTGLYFASTVSRLCGSDVGRNAFKYTVIGFSEQQRGCLSNVTSVRDSWNDILKDQRKSSDSRIIAGLNYNDVFSQGLHQPMEEFPIVEYYTRPKGINGQSEIVHGELCRTKSLTPNSLVLPARITSVRKNSAPWSRIVDRGHTVPVVDGSFCRLPSRMSTHSGPRKGSHFSAISSFSCAKEATVGSILFSDSLRGIISLAGTDAWIKWQQRRLSNPVISGSLHMCSSLNAGTALALVCDAFGRTTELDTFYPPLGNIMPQKIFPLGDDTLRTFSFDLNSLIGFSQHVNQNNFADVNFILYIIDTNASPCNSAWDGTIFWHMAESDSTPLSATLPLSPTDVNTLDLWRGPFKFKQGSTVVTEVLPLNFATAIDFSTGYNSAMSFNMAKLGQYIGYSGTLHGEVVPIGSAFCKADLYLSMWWEARPPSLRDIIRYDGWELEGGRGTFELEINSLYKATSARVADAHLAIRKTGGVVAPDAITAPFSYMVYFSKISFNMELPPMISPRLEFDWAELTSIASAGIQFRMPVHLPDLIVTGAKVNMLRHPLALMVATSGLMRGTLRFKFRWSSEVTIATASATISLSACFGKDDDILRHQTLTTHVSFHKELSIDLVSTDVGGFVTSGGRGKRENFALCDITKSHRMSVLYVAVEVLPGFEFRGPTITPLVAKILASADSGLTVMQQRALDVSGR